MYGFHVARAMLLAAGLAAAQGPRNQGKGGMMGPGMGPGMRAGMHDPMHEAVAAAFGLPQMKAELGLSTQQETQLGQLKEELLKKGEDLSTQIAAKHKELDAAAGAGRNAEVKQFLEQMATLRAHMQFTAFEAAGRMKAALTEPQRARLAGHEFHHAMMMRMTVGDMGRMMPFMSGGGGMIGHDMMDHGKKETLRH